MRSFRSGLTNNEREGILLFSLANSKKKNVLKFLPWGCERSLIRVKGFKSKEQIQKFFL